MEENENKVQLHSGSCRVREIENVSAFKNQVWGPCNSIWERQPVIKIHFSHILWPVIEERWVERGGGREVQGMGEGERSRLRNRRLEVREK